MSQFSYPECTDDLVRSPGYINGLLAAIRRAFNVMGPNNFGPGSVVPASLADDKSIAQIVLYYEGQIGPGVIVDEIIALVNIAEIENPSDEGMVLESIFGVASYVIGGDATVSVYRYPAGGGPSLLKTLTFTLANSPREKVSDKTISQVFYKDDLLVLKASIAGAGDLLGYPSVVCEFVTPHATS